MTIFHFKGVQRELRGSVCIDGSPWLCLYNSKTHCITSINTQLDPDIYVPYPYIVTSQVGELAGIHEALINQNIAIPASKQSSPYVVEIINPQLLSEIQIAYERLTSN